MTLNELGDLVLKQAEEKGWGHTKEMLNVAEKMMLIITEITEFELALKTNPTNPKDTIQAENAAILIRTLHLGRAWGVDFNAELEFESKFRGVAFEGVTDKDLLYLYSLVSDAYENYRHKENDIFKKYLYIIAKEVVYLTEGVGRNVETIVLETIEINKARVWDKTKFQEQLSK